MAISGNGTNGKRLWYRTPDHRWIAVPYGAGQDDKVRSINIWDGQKWMVPAWGWWLANRALLNPKAEQFWRSIPGDGFYVHAPGVEWQGYASDDPTDRTHAYNPNFGAVSFGDFVFGRWQNYAKGTLQLFNTEPRNDPNWRIVPLANHVLPVAPVAQHYQDPYDPYGVYQPATGDYGRFFWPSVGVTVYYPETFTTNVYAATSSPKGSDSVYNGSLVAQTFDNVAYAQRLSSFNSSLIIDFQAIRQQLHDTFGEQGVYYQGQYTHIDHMVLKRVYIKARVSAQVEIGGGRYNPLIHQFQIDTTPIDGITFTVTANTNTPTTDATLITDPGLLWPGEKPLRYPENTQPEGPSIWTLTTSEEGISVSEYGTDAVWYHAEDLPAFEFEGPGEDNIGLACNITGVPGTGGDLRSVTTNLYFTLQQITLQYAAVGHDVPDELKRYDAIG